MQLMVVLLIGAFVIGGTGVGRWVRERPVLLLPIATVAAGSFYSLRVVL